MTRLDASAVFFFLFFFVSVFLLPLFFVTRKQIPEGLVTAIPEMEVLIEEIDALYVEHAGPESSSNTLSRDEVQKRLTVWSKALLASLPAFIQEEVSVVLTCFTCV